MAIKKLTIGGFVPNSGLRTEDVGGVSLYNVKSSQNKLPPYFLSECILDSKELNRNPKLLEESFVVKDNENGQFKMPTILTILQVGKVLYNVKKAEQIQKLQENETVKSRKVENLEEIYDSFQLRIGSKNKKLAMEI